MKVKVSAQARAYLRTEAAYLKRHSNQAALNFRNRIAEARQHLATFPELGRDIERLPVEGARRLVMGNYVLDYDIAGDEITILSIRHGQQIEMDPDLDADFDFEDPPGPGSSRSSHR